MNRYAVFILFMVLLGACCKEPETVPDDEDIAPCYEKFLGNYHVTDLQSLEEYNMTISHFSSVNEFGVEVDSIVMTNFDQRFDVKFNFSCNELATHLGWKFHFGQQDYAGNHWALYYSLDDTVESYPQNTLHGDTILFMYDKSNIAFYLDEGVPYEECIKCMALAVKQ